MAEPTCHFCAGTGMLPTGEGATPCYCTARPPCLSGLAPAALPDEDPPDLLSCKACPSAIAPTGAGEFGACARHGAYSRAIAHGRGGVRV